MSAGTIVIAGGILAAVILLCIVAVLCYCRLQVLLAAKSLFELLIRLIRYDHLIQDSLWAARLRPG